MGPTASGKSEVAELLAEDLDAVLLNADAFQIYRGMDIGTAKPTDRRRYRLLDIRNPNEGFGVGEWIRLAQAELNDAWRAQRHVIVVGGTALYIRALFDGYEEMSGPPPDGLRERLRARLDLEGLDSLVEELRTRAPETAEKVDLRNPQRVMRALEKLESPKGPIDTAIPPFLKWKFGLQRDPQSLKQVIAGRTERMLGEGWIEEVKTLLQNGFGPEDPGFRAHGYRAITAYLRGEMEYAGVLEQTVVEVRQYAKRQRTWLRRELGMVWIPDEVSEAMVRMVKTTLKVG